MSTNFELNIREGRAEQVSMVAKEYEAQHAEPIARLKFGPTIGSKVEQLRRELTQATDFTHSQQCRWLHMTVEYKLNCSANAKQVVFLFCIITCGPE
jgi:hypothetical protein